MLSPRHAPTQPRRARLHVEALEDRATPAVLNVNSLADVLSPPAGTVTLRSALQQANAAPGGNTINLTLPGTYQIALPGSPTETDNAAGEFAYTGTGNLSIINTSGGRVVVDGGGLNRVFDLNPAAQTATPFTVTVQGFTVTGGSTTGGGGGIRAQGAASVVLDSVTLSDNLAATDGGGIALESISNLSSGTLTVRNSFITGNHAGDAGGGIESDGTGTITVTGSTVRHNTCLNQGGGVWLDDSNANLNMTGDLIADNVSQFMLAGGIGNAGAGAVTLVSCTVENNVCGSSLQTISGTPTFVPGAGGGFADATNVGRLTVTNCLFLHNSAPGGGGAISEGGPSTAISGSTFEGNVSGTNGGAVFAFGATVRLTNDVFRHNVAAAGGAVEDDAADFAAAHCSFEANRAVSGGGAASVAGPALGTNFTACLFLGNAAVGGNGGAIVVQAGDLAVNNSQFTGNLAGGSGGAIQFSATRINLFASTFNNNRAVGNGGAVNFSSANPSTFQDCTFTGNAAGVNGGAVFDSVSVLILVSDTVNGNSTGYIGGGVGDFTAGSVSLTNTIIYGNATGLGAADLFSTTITDNGGNLIGVAPPGFGAGTLTGVNPLLGRLQNNGGFLAGAYGDQQVVQTEALLRGSPALGAGVASLSNRDARGFPSPAAGRTRPSIGAYEPQYAATASANQVFVENVYEVLLNRTGDAGAANFVARLGGGATPTAVVQMIENTTEYQTAQVQSLYQRYLHRAADAGGLQGFVNFVAGGGTYEQVAAFLAGSQEYFDLHGDTNDGYLQALYEDALGRAGDDAGLTGFAQSLAGGATRASVAALVFGSQEYLADLVGADYQGLLGRPADTAGLTGFVGALQAGALTDQQVLAFILGSAEAFAKRS